MWTDAAKNNAVAAEGTTHLSLHTAYSATGANEATGGSPAYARQAASWASPASGSKSLSAALTFDVPAGTYKWAGRWTALTGGTFLGMQPLGGASREFTTDLTANTIGYTAHGYANDSRVVFMGGTPPGGLAAGTEYFVVNTAANTFQVAATQGGAAIDLTAQAAAGCVMSAIDPQVYTGQGQLILSATFSLHLNF